MEWLFAVSDTIPVEMRAEALLNADPRRFGDDTRRHSEEMLAVVAADFALAVTAAAAVPAAAALVAATAAPGSAKRKTGVD